MRNVYNGFERRKFLRLDYITPLAYKVCKKETISKLLQGYTSDISEAGLLCNITAKVKKDDILWLAFDRDTLAICEELDKRSLIYQNGIIGKVVRIEYKKDKSLNVGVLFITREEKNLTNIYPQTHFLKDQKEILSAKPKQDEETETEEYVNEQGTTEEEIKEDQEQDQQTKEENEEI